MATITFTARNDSGEILEGDLDATDANEALEIIIENGLTPVTVNGSSVGSNGTSTKSGASHRKRGRGAVQKEKVVKKKAKAPKKAKAKPGKGKDAEAGTGLNMNINIGGPKKVKPKELMIFTRQLATLVNAGLPLVRSLEVLEDQTENPTLYKAVGEMTEAIKSGSTFAESLTAHPKIFDKLYVNMVRAGEIGGVLDKVLVSLSEFMEKLQKIKGAVVSAMVYPAVVMTMATVILVLLMIFIIPKFAQIFEDVLGEGAELPFLTRIVMGISNILINYWYLLIGGIVLFVVLFKYIAKTDKGSATLDRIKLRIPLFGDLIRKSSISRMTRTLGVLMDSGVPVLQALAIVRETSGNIVLAEAINSVHDSVKEGENMAPPMQSTGLFPPMVISMVEVGEETGELPDMLMRVADNYEEEVDNTVNAMTSVIEPIMIVALAIIVGCIVIALFLPLIKLITGLESQ